MYSLENRSKAVGLYFKYDGNVAAVVRELGY
ncbi:MAG: integrase, partial [Bacillota bacterium]